ncbi:MAG: toxin-antitoxin system YwqK family antitoxin [Sporocytophaga sp.]|nr:toxin-antitoxin system YwqK family antitoxin [Sporocytophaga sp.]
MIKLFSKLIITLVLSLSFFHLQAQSSCDTTKKGDWKVIRCKKQGATIVTSVYKDRGPVQKVYWDANGNLESEEYTFVSINTITYSWKASYYTDGQLKEESYFLFPQVEWHPNGNLRSLKHQSIYELKWTQDGKSYYPKIYRRDTLGVPKDTTQDKYWIEDIYTRFNNPKNKNLKISQNKTNGYHASYYDNKQVKFETVIKNGRPDSYFKAYYPNGQLAIEWTLKDGVPDGKYTWYEVNGKVKRSGFFKMGVPSGIWKAYNENGIIDSEFEYDNSFPKNDKFTYKKTYDTDGKLNMHLVYKNGLLNGLQRNYYPNGTISYEVEKTDGKETGVCKKYYENGSFKEQSYYVKGKLEGPLETWHYNNQKASITHYKNNQKHGEKKNWYKNGQLSLSGSYFLDQENGKWQFFDTTGTLIEERSYEKGNRIQGPKDVPCFCSDQIGHAISGPLLSEKLDSVQLIKYEFKFHETISNYLSKLHYRGEYLAFPKPGGPPSDFLNFATYKQLEVGIPDKHGIKLILNPCLNKGEFSYIKISYVKNKANPDLSEATLLIPMLAFKFDRTILKPEIQDLDSKAYFRVESLHYSKSGIDFRNAEAVCFPKSQIGVSKLNLKLVDFKPLIYSSEKQLNEYQQAVNLYKNLNPDLLKQKTFAGLIQGFGNIQFTMQDIELDVQVKDVIAEKDFRCRNSCH